jgi:hypothetical protein
VPLAFWDRALAARGGGRLFDRAVTPARRGFGTTVISLMPEMQLAADVQLAYAREGVTWHLTCAADKVLERTAAASGSGPASK